MTETKSKSKVGAPKANRNAARANQNATSHLIIRVTPAEKAKVVRDADKQTISEYIRSRLGI